MTTDHPTPQPAGGSVSTIEFRDVLKKFGDNTVLKDLNFSVAPGERVALIGPSGSGKTTILRLAMTLEELTDGYIFVDGEPLVYKEEDGKRVRLSDKQRRAKTQRIGMVFQHFNLFPNMTVLENIVEAPIHVRGLKRSQAQEAASALLDQVGLSDKKGARPNELSGGQQQRVAIARALAMDPQVLLLDEVTSALDPELVGDVLGVLREIASTTDITMLIVTHEMQFAREVAHRVLMFDEGRIIEEAAPQKIFTEPEQQRTKTFLRAVL